VYPALVTVVEAIRHRRRPSRLMLGALALSIGGSALVAAGGARLAISGTGVAFALCSAATFAGYVTVGSRLNEHSDAVVTGAWVALGAAASFTLRALIGPGYATVHGHWPVLMGNGVANAVAFGAMFAALGLLGPARAAVVLTLEAVFAVILSTTLLDESITALQLVGAVGVLAAAVTVARMSAPAVAETETAVAP
jgi:drug/metabolite transporter (DMT)-like permease